MSAEAKVGVFLIISLVLIVGVLLFLTDYAGRRGTYEFYVIFEQAQGVGSGAPVQIAGVRVGEVAAVGLTPDYRARVTLRVKKSVEVRRNYPISIAIGALIGEKRIEITRVPPQLAGPLIKPGSEVIGVEKARLEDLIGASDELVGRVNTALEGITGILGDEELMATLRDAIINFNRLSAQAEKLVVNMTVLAQENRGSIRQLLHHLAGVAKDMHEVSDSLAPQLAKTSIPEDLEETVRSIRSATDRIDRILASFEPMADEPELGQSVKEAIVNMKDSSRNVKEATAHAKEVMAKVRKISKTKVTPTFDLLYMPEPDRWWGEANLDLQWGSPDFLRLGVADIGETDRVNLQWGRWYRDRYAVRLGVIQSKLGIGWEGRLADQWGLSLDVFDPNRVRANLMAQYYFRNPEGLAATIGVRNLFRENYFAAGVRIRR